MDNPTNKLVLIRGDRHVESQPVISIMHLCNLIKSSCLHVLGLNTPSPTANRLALGFASGNTTSDMSGTIVANIDINRVTGVISSLDFTGGLITTTNWTMNTTFGPLSGTNIVATIDTTPVAPGSSVSAGNFNATEQLLILNGGSVNLPAAEFTQNFATTPLNIPGAGTGSLTSVLNNGVFNLAFSMPINNTQVLQGQNLTIVGSLQATGQVTAVPEPGSIVLCGLAAIGGLAVRRRAAVRRKQSAQ